MNLTFDFGEKALQFEMRIWNKGALVESHPDHPGETDAPHARNFIDCPKSRKTPNADIAIGHASTTLSHLGNIVARTGRNLKFDARSETIAGDAEASALLRREYRPHWSVPKGV